MEGKKECLGLLQIGKFEKKLNLSTHISACAFQKAYLEENEQKKCKRMITEGREGSEMDLAQVEVLDPRQGVGRSHIMEIAGNCDLKL